MCYTTHVMLIVTVWDLAWPVAFGIMCYTTHVMLTVTVWEIALQRGKQLPTNDQILLLWVDKM